MLFLVTMEDPHRRFVSTARFLARMIAASCARRPCRFFEHAAIHAICQYSGTQGAWLEGDLSFGAIGLRNVDRDSMGATI